MFDFNVQIRTTGAEFIRSKKDVLNVGLNVRKKLDC